MSREVYILKYPIEISSADADMFGRLRPGSLLNYLIQAAGLSADRLGFGYSDLKKQDCFWVLNQMEIQMDETPQWRDEITIETWPKSIKKLFYLRDFLIKSKNGKILGRAQSSWLVIHAPRRRPTLLKNFEASFADLSNYHAMTGELQGLEKINQGKVLSERMATFTDIDINQHLTSVRYVDWIMDSFSMDFHREHEFRALNIRYLKETRPGESLSIRHEEMQGLQFRVEGRNLQNHKSSFQCLISFNKSS
jgi:medium-chain acyl-[acyl-carrier-protein] hydrolase